MLLLFQQLSKSAEAVVPFDGPLLVREVTVKDAKHIVIQRIGERSEYQLNFEVSITYFCIHTYRIAGNF